MNVTGSYVISHGKIIVPCFLSHVLRDASLHSKRQTAGSQAVYFFHLSASFGHGTLAEKQLFKPIHSIPSQVAIHVGGHCGYEISPLVPHIAQVRKKSSRIF
jgi:hypothetical protein